MREKGFTLVELLVTVAIISALIVFLLPQLNSFQRRQALKDSSSDLQTALRSVQNSAVSGVKCTDGSSSSSWYIKFTSTDRGAYETWRTCNGNEERVKTYKLPSNVKISSVEVDTCLDIDLLDGSDLFAKAIFKSISGDVDFDFNQSGCPNPKITKPTKMEVNLIDSSLLSDNEITIVIEKGGSVYLSPLKTGSVAPTPTPVSGGGGTDGSSDPTATPTPTPTSIPMPSPCTLISASWSAPSNPVVEGTEVGLFVNTSGNCTGKQVSFEVRESDSLGSSGVTTNPSSEAIFNNQAIGTWVSEYQSDIWGWGLPEYYFIVTLVDSIPDQTIQSIDPKLEVSEATVLNPAPTPIPTPTPLPPTTLTLDTVDDGYAINNWGNNETSDVVRVGISPDDVVGPYDGGFRFSLPVPKGATIDSAYLSVYLQYTWDNNPVTINLKVENTSNSTPLSGVDSSLFIPYRTYFLNSTSWTLPPSSWNSFVTSPDIANLIQDVVNQEGWVSENYILVALLRVSDKNFAQLISNDAPQPKVAKLIITYH